MTPAPQTNPATDPLAALGASLTPKRAVSYVRVSTREQAERGGHDGATSEGTQALLTHAIHCSHVRGPSLGSLSV